MQRYHSRQLTLHILTGQDSNVYEVLRLISRVESTASVFATVGDRCICLRQ